MPRLVLLCFIAIVSLTTGSVAAAAAPTGFSPPRTVGAGVQVTGVVAAADAANGRDGAVAFGDRSGGVWAARVRPDGGLGSPLLVGADQGDLRDVQVAVTDRGEIVVVWPALVDRSGRSAVRYAAAAPGRGFSGARTLATVGSSTGATPRVAALPGGTVAVVFRDVRPPHTTGVLRYARRPAGGSFGPARSLGHDGITPQVEPAPRGGALLAWGRGPLARRALEVSTARPGAPLPGPATSVAGHVRAISLAASADGTAWVAWTRRGGGPATGFARRIRAGNRPGVGPVAGLGTVAYGTPHVALGAGGRVLAAWNARGPGTAPNVTLAAAQGSGAALGAANAFGAGGFSQTSPIPALLRVTPLVLFTRQIANEIGVRSEVAAADPATGDTTVLGAAANGGAPAVAHLGDSLVVAWAAGAGGGVAVSVDSAGSP